MSRRLRPTKFKRLRNIFKHRFVRPLTVALLFAVIGSALIFLSQAADDDENYPPVAPNPSISSQSCVGGLSIALVADVSGSIVKQPEGFRAMQDAFRDFVSALLPSTQTQFSVTEFGNNGRVIRPFTKDVGALNSAIESFTKNTGAGTNWPDGLDDGFGTFSSAPANTPRLLVIATDGNPNVNGMDDDETMIASIESANRIKNAGVHIIALGIEGDDGRPDVENLRYISGNRVNTGGINADVITSDFDSLRATMQEIARNTCVSPMPPPPPTGNGGFGNGSGGNGNGNGGFGNGNGTGGTGTGDNGTGTGQNGTGRGTGGRGAGSNGDGTGTGIGTTPAPSPNPTPTASEGTTPSPSPTNVPDQDPTPAPVSKPDPQPNPSPAPTPTAQGLRNRPPDEQPSPFYDGKEFAPGSITDSFVPSAKQRNLTWLYVGIGALVLAAGGGFLVWRKYFKGKLPIPILGAGSKANGKPTRKPKKKS